MKDATIRVTKRALKILAFVKDATGKPKIRFASEAIEEKAKRDRITKPQN